jgi:hypothetical protein
MVEDHIMGGDIEAALRRVNRLRVTGQPHAFAVVMA